MVQHDRVTSNCENQTPQPSLYANTAIFDGVCQRVLSLRFYKAISQFLCAPKPSTVFFLLLLSCCVSRYHCLLSSCAVTRHSIMQHHEPKECGGGHCACECGKQNKGRPCSNPNFCCASYWVIHRNIPRKPIAPTAKARQSFGMLPLHVAASCKSAMPSIDHGWR